MDTNRHETVAGDGNALSTGDPGNEMDPRKPQPTAAATIFRTAKDLRRRRTASGCSRAVPGNLARANEIDERRNRSERTRARLRHERPMGGSERDGRPSAGLPPLRRDWILKRGDVDEIEGRVVRPIDDGYLSDKHAACRNVKRQRLNRSRRAIAPQTVARTAQVIP